MAARKAGKLPSSVIAAKTIAVKLAAGPLTINCEPLTSATTRPPMTPAMIPEVSGAPDASATPRHNGSATSGTMSPARMSSGIAILTGNSLARGEVSG
jgi:hypothetical protein